MKAPHFNPSAVAELRGRIESADVLEAFDRLVEFGTASPVLDCAQGSRGANGRGAIRDFRYTSTDPKGWPFAFTVSRAHLLFYIRPLAMRTLRLTKTVLARRIEVVRKRADLELQVVVRNLREADAVVEHLLSRWPQKQAPVENRALTDARRGVGQFRANVEQIEGACRVTGVMDRRHLRAVHIKSWEACSDAEKLDRHNGLLLSPHVAHLFERGYISFLDDGQMRVARQLNSTVLKRWAISSSIAARAFVARQKPFLAWHRENVFEKTEAGRRRKD